MYHIPANLAFADAKHIWGTRSSRGRQKAVVHQKIGNLFNKIIVWVPKKSAGAFSITGIANEYDRLIGCRGHHKNRQPFSFSFL